MREAWAMAMVVLSCAPGCLGDDDGRVDLSQGCDIRRAACQEAVLDATRAARDQEQGEAPEIRTIELDAYEDELRELVEEGLADSDSAQAWAAALQLIGLLSPDMDLGDALVADRVDSVLAYYDAEQAAVTIIDRATSAEPLDQVFVLAHELTHALQDQEMDLRGFSDAWIDSTDSGVAIDSLIEGEAMVVAAGVLDETSGPLRALNWSAFLSSVRDNTFESLGEAAEPFLAAMNGLPYTLGSVALAGRYRNEGADSVKRVYAAPPTSVADWNAQRIDDGPRQSRELRCFPTTPPAGYAGFDHDTLGMTGLFALRLAVGDDATVAWDGAERWLDDSLVVFRAEDGDTLHAVAWRIQLDLPSSRMEDARAELQAALPGGLVLPVEPLTGFDEGALTVLAADDPAVLEAWGSMEPNCGSADELPEDEESDGAMMMRVPMELRGRRVF